MIINCQYTDDQGCILIR